MLKNKILFLVGLIFCLASRYLYAEFNFSATFDSEGLKNFYFEISNYYKVPEKEIVVVQEKKIVADETPVVFFIAKKANVNVNVIIDLRSKGKSWFDIARQYNLTAEDFYVEANSYPEKGPYGKALGHYKKKNRNQWKSIVLDDSDVVNLVNLRFISEHYNITPDEVINMRSGGKNFVVINNEIVKEKHKNKEKKEKEKDKDRDKGHGKRHK